MTDDNLKLWNLVEKTPLEQTKSITGKSYKGTSPKPHYLVHKATETFGPIGIGWGFEIVDERIEEGADGERMSIARVKVWYIWNDKRGELEHIGGTSFSGKRNNGKFYTDEDAPKKSVTDALIKALSMIGFAGDIFMGRYDDSKYVQELRDDANETPQVDMKAVKSVCDKALSDIKDATNDVGLKNIWATVDKANVPEENKAPIISAINVRLEEIKKFKETTAPSAADSLDSQFPGDL